MSGQTDLSEILASITVSVRPDDYVIVALPSTTPPPPLGDGVAALITEAEGTTVVSTFSRAAHEEWPYDFVASWLTIDIHSALESIGLTATFSRQLGRAGIPCNVLAGFFHDHILVPHDKRDAAVEVIEALRGAKP